MAKRINILSAGGTIPFADNGLKLSKSIKISEIELHDDFKSLFTIDNDLLQRIINSIRDDKYDNSQPVHIWVYTDEDETTHYYLIDGHTRVKAAEEAGLETIPYFEHKFDSFEDAYKYALGLQVNRRNLGGSELLRNISKLYGTDFIQSTGGKKSEAIAEILGVSDRTVEKGMYIQEHADEETLAKIDSDELSVNKAYKQLKEKAQKQESNDDGDFVQLDDMEELPDALNDNEGTPRSLNFKHSDGIERPSHKISPEEDSERTRERRKAYQMGKVDGMTMAFKYVTARMLEGMDARQLYSEWFLREPEETEAALGSFSLSEADEKLIGTMFPSGQPVESSTPPENSCMNPHGRKLCGSAAWCGEGHECCKDCTEDCNIRCGWLDDSETASSTSDDDVFDIETEHTHD